VAAVVTDFDLLVDWRGNTVVCWHS
jgi:hypothetical protein